MNKTERIEMRVTPEEKMYIVSKSQKANLSITEFLIKSSNQNKIIVIQGLPKIAEELRRIGNNINQLTKLSNSKIINCVDLEETKKELQKIWQSLNLLITKSV